MSSSIAKCLLPFQLYLLFFTASASCTMSCLACVELGSANFDKVVSRFPVSLVKFGEHQPRGEKHDIFAKFADSAAMINDFLIAEVPIRNYADMENMDLKERFNIELRKRPVVYLFLRKDNKLEEHKFEEKPFNSSTLKGFVRNKAGIRVTERGCIGSLDDLAEEMMNEGPNAYDRVLMKARQEVKRLETDKEKQQGNVYIKIMERIISHGVDHLVNEKKRLERLLKSETVTKLKKRDLTERLNILNAFFKNEVANETKEDL